MMNLVTTVKTLNPGSGLLPGDAFLPVGAGGDNQRTAGGRPTATGGVCQRGAALFARLRRYGSSGMMSVFYNGDTRSWMYLCTRFIKFVCD